MRKRTRKQLKATAYHEAGHAVIGRVLTVASGGVTIRPSQDAWGQSIVADPYACLYQWEKRGKVRALDSVWRARIMAYMAGAETEIVLLGHPPAGDSWDRSQIGHMARELCYSPSWGKLEPRLRAMTCMLIRRHRARIERVAKALLAKTTLSAKQVDKLSGRSVDDVRVNAPFLLAMHAQTEKRKRG
jgi:ATP-dependent Zn protease